MSPFRFRPLQENPVISLGYRLLIAASALAGLAAACSDSSSTTTPVVGGAGASSGGTSPGAGSTGGSSGGAGDNVSSNGGAGAAGAGGSACDPACTAGKLCVQGTCKCPGYAPDHCAVAGKCTDFSADPDFCGNCETACSMMSACSAGACRAAPVELYNTTTACNRLNLALQGSTLYWVDEGAGSLWSMAVSGGDASELLDGLTDASAIVTDASNAYVVTGSSLSRVPLTGGAAETIVTEATPIFDVALQDGTLFYAAGKTIKSVAVDADAAAGNVVATAVDSGDPEGVAVSGDYVLFASNTSYNVEADLIEGDGLLKLGASQGGLMFGAGSLSSDATHVYWAVGSNVVRAAFAGEDMGQENVASSRSNQDVTAFEVTGTTVYLGSAGDLEKAELGAESVWMARNQSAILSIVLGATQVYWSTDDCKIRSTDL